LGRSYDAVIRVNSQSGKGGIAYLLEAHYGVVLPRRLQIEFSQAVQQYMDNHGTEVTAQNLWSLLNQSYVQVHKPYQPINYELTDKNGKQHIKLFIEHNGGDLIVEGNGNGPISAVINALGLPLDVLSYEERSIGQGASAQALAIIELNDAEQQLSTFGLGIHDNIVTASIHAILACANRLDALKASQQTQASRQA
jgi:2-isopropylmalate synthase